MVLSMKMHAPTGPRPIHTAPEPPLVGKQSSKEKPAGLFRSGTGKLSIPKPAAINAPATETEFHEVVEALARLVSLDSQYSSLVVAYGFVPPVLNILSIGASESVMLLALRTLAHLASSKETLASIRSAGALPILISMLDESSPSLALGALEVLRPLARDSEMKVLLREAGAFKHLVKLIQAAARPGADVNFQVTAAAEAALAVVKNLAASIANQDALRSVGLIKALVAIIDVVPATSAAAVRAAATLSNLAVSNQANKKAIRESGALPRLVTLLGAGGEAAAAATEAFGNLAAKNTENKDAIREAGGVAALASQFIALGASTGMDKHARTRRARHDSGGLQSSNSGRESISDSRSTSRSHSPTPSFCDTSTPPASQPSSAVSSPCCSQPNSRPTSRPTSRCASPRAGAGSRPSSPPPLLPDAAPGAALSGGALSAIMPSAPSSLLPKPSQLTPAFVPSPPGTARGAAAGRGEPHHHSEVSLERTAWTLRNLTAASGLNTAVITASGISLKALDATNFKEEPILAKAHGQKQSAPPLLSSQPRAPPPPRPKSLPVATTDDDDEDEDGPGRACTAGVGLAQWAKTGRAW